MEYHLSHAMILEGPDPEANLALAEKLAQQAVCTAGGRRPCGVCRDCVKAAGGSHPDIAVYGGKGGSRSFHVEEVRQIRDSAAVMPNEAQAKVYILDGADHMTEQAAYSDLLRTTPKNGAVVNTPEGRGVVVDVNLLTGMLKVRMDRAPEAAPMSFHAKQVKVIKDSQIKVAKEEVEKLKDLEG